MHPEAMAFVQRARARVDDLRLVVEVGSYDVNGSVRPLFADARTYLGYDVRDGPGVDVVGDVRHYDSGPRASVIISTEALEHTPAPHEVIAGMVRMLIPGGALILTMAAPERAPHGCDGQHPPPPGEHYGNIAPADLRRWLADLDMLVEWLEHDPRAGDLYALAWKPLGVR
jgi:hypothetical protein